MLYAQGFVTGTNPGTLKQRKIHPDEELAYKYH